jgi:prepilin-type N-terminal cleavage/methylation domain-containing protein
MIAVSRTDRRGFTLMELMIVLAVAGILLVTSWPRVRSILLQSNVKSARNAVISLYQQGRSQALQSGRETWIWFGQNSVWVTAKPRRTACSGTCTYDTIGTVRNLNQQYGVTITASPDTFVKLNARGLGLTSNSGSEYVAIVRSAAADTIRINQLGRVTK